MSFPSAAVATVMKSGRPGQIDWAKRLERAGAHVAYGILGLKTHCKTLLIVRREGSTLSLLATRFASLILTRKRHG